MASHRGSGYPARQISPGRGSALAFAGKLVVVAVTGEDYEGNKAASGHVAILLPKRGNRAAPLVYGGASNAAARSAGTKTVREVFRVKKHSVVRCYQHKTALLGKFD